MVNGEKILAERLIEKYLEKEEKIAERAYDLVKDILIEEITEQGCGRYRAILPASVDESCDDTKVIGKGFIEEKAQQLPTHSQKEYLWENFTLWRKFTLFRYEIFYRVVVELAQFKESDAEAEKAGREHNERFCLLRIMAEIPIIDVSRFKEAAEKRDETLKRVCDERGIGFYKMQGVYILIKKLDFSNQETLLVDLAIFCEGLWEWYNTDPAR